MDTNVSAALKNAVMEVWAADGRSEGSAKGHEVWADRTCEPDDDELGEVLKDYIIV